MGHPRTVCVQFVSLECIKPTPGRGYDEIYFRIIVNDGYYGTYPVDAHKGDTFKMNLEADYRNLDLDFRVSYESTLMLRLMEQDSTRHPDRDDDLGKMYIKVDHFDLSETKPKWFEFVSEENESRYVFYYRLVSQKLPSFRILGLYCQRSSCGCNKDLADALFDTTAAILSNTGKALGYTDNPETKEVAEALEMAGTIVEGVKVLSEWMANAIEGADDVYIQHTIEGQQAHDHVAICPPDGGEIKMNDGDKIAFMDKYGRYFRIPLDIGSVSIEVRERDPVKHDCSLGAMTVTLDDYNKYVDQGGMCQPLSTYYDNQNGEGAVYHICYSFAFEDWTLNPNQKD